jgi:hypothetical protein
MATVLTVVKNAGANVGNLPGPILAIGELVLIAALKWLQQKRAAKTVVQQIEQSPLVPLGTPVSPPETL